MATQIKMDEDTEKTMKQVSYTHIYSILPTSIGRYCAYACNDKVPFTRNCIDLHFD